MFEKNWNLGELLSLVFGLSNLLVWILIAFPQLFMNFRNRSSKAVSYLMYLKWTIGGVISLTTAYIKGANITVLYVGIHHSIINVLLITQLIYYRIKDKTYITKFESIVTIILGITVILLLILVTITKNTVLIEVLAWIACCIFSSSRLQQIYLNWKRKSVEGLSLVSFISMVVVDAFFVTSILINAIDNKKTVMELFLLNAQWITCCIITATCSIIILFQFNYYHKKRSDEEEQLLENQ